MTYRKLSLALALAMATTLAHAEPAPKLPDPPPLKFVDDTPKTTLPTSAANADVYSRIRGNLDRLGRPDLLSLAVVGALALVDYVIDPANTEAQPLPQPNPQAVPQPNPATGGIPSCDMQSGQNISTYFNELIDKYSSQENYSHYEVSKFADTGYQLNIYRTANTTAGYNKPYVLYVHRASCLQPSEEELQDPENVPNPKEKPKPSPAPNPNDDPNANDEKKNKDENPKPFEFPAFCDWATHVCDFIVWMKEEPPSPDEIPKIPIQEVDKKFDINPNLYNASGQCPAPITVNIAFGQIQIPYDYLCMFFAKNSPLIIAISYLIGAFIVLGKR